MASQNSISTPLGTPTAANHNLNSGNVSSLSERMEKLTVACAKTVPAPDTDTLASTFAVENEEEQTNQYVYTRTSSSYHTFVPWFRTNYSFVKARRRCSWRYLAGTNFHTAKSNGASTIYSRDRWEKCEASHRAPFTRRRKRTIQEEDEDLPSFASERERGHFPEWDSTTSDVWPKSYPSPKEVRSKPDSTSQEPWSRSNSTSEEAMHLLSAHRKHIK